MSSLIIGNAFHCRDFVDTDVMSPGRFEPYVDEAQLARIALIDYESPIPFVDPATGKSTFKVIVAGHEFGCGSSRETAPQALYYAGARVVIAKSFARIFFRNCVNMGLLLPIQLAHPWGESITGKEITIDLVTRTVSAEGETFEYADLGPLERIVSAGGLTSYNKQRARIAHDANGNRTSSLGNAGLPTVRSTRSVACAV